MTHKTVIIDAEKLCNSTAPIEELTAICRNMLKTYKPDFVTLCISNKVQGDVLAEVSDLCDAMGISLSPAQSVSSSIKSLVEQAKTSTVIATTDNGLCQLVRDDVLIHDLSEDQLIDAQKLKSSIGLNPDQIPVFLALCGYSSMDLPAIPFANPPQIIEALKATGETSFNGNLLAALPKLIQQKLMVHKDAILSRIDRISESSPDTSISFVRRRPLDPQKIYGFYLKHKLYRWLPDDVREKHNIFLDGKIGARSVFVNNESLQQELKASVKQKGSFAIFCDEAVYSEDGIISLCTEQGDCFTLSVSSPDSIHLLKELLEDSSLGKVTNESKLLYRVCDDLDINLQNLLSDVQMGSHVVDSHNGKLDFAGKVKQLTGISPATKSQYFKSNINDNKRIGGVIEYMSDMADLTLRTNRKIYQSLLQSESTHILHELELPLSKVLMQIEKTGVLIDKDNLEKFGVLVDKKLNESRQEILKHTGKELNVNSPKEITTLLYEKLGLGKYVKNQDASEEALETLSEFHPLPAVILNCRILSSMKSSYIDGLLSKINQNTGRIYTTYQQDPATTGRLSSRDPNLQSIPTKRKEARRIKQSFIAEGLNKIYAADYSQVELRILAHLSQDEKLIRAFKEGRDIHRATAAEVLGIPESSVTKDQRRQAKAINFGLIYGKTAFGLGKDLGIPAESAQKYIDTYFQRYQGVAKYLEGVKAHARKHGYVKTLMGRRIYTPNINSENFGIAKKAERSAINAPVQGTAADIMKKAMVLTFNEMQAKELKSKMIMQIHDELVFEVDESEVALVDELVKRNMESAANLIVPLTVESDIGLNWEESHSLEDNNNHNIECVA